MYQYEVRFYVSGVSGQISLVVTAASHLAAASAVKAMYSGKAVQIHSVNRV